MKRFIVNENEWSVPNCWEDMSLKNYIDFFLFQESNSGREIDDLVLNIHKEMIW